MAAKSALPVEQRRQDGTRVNNRTCCRATKAHDLPQKPPKRVAEPCHAATLCALRDARHSNYLWMKEGAQERRVNT